MSKKDRKHDIPAVLRETPLLEREEVVHEIRKIARKSAENTLQFVLNELRRHAEITNEMADRLEAGISSKDFTGRAEVRRLRRRAVELLKTVEVLGMTLERTPDSARMMATFREPTEPVLGLTRVLNYFRTPMPKNHCERPSVDEPTQS